MTNSAVHRFEYNGWNVVVELDGSTPDGVISGRADLHWNEGHRCRIALAGRHESGASAIASLSQRSRVFIDDWRTNRLEDGSDFPFQQTSSESCVRKVMERAVHQMK
ncbi:hypothetical protein QTH97_23915 [Variovorax sp. J22R24]|uniref:hypothetical protein n=1 Tax=Variovorax gracilis TaxID=3053502 RepID=UPI002578A02A|nr:hypothetical protein [Variovorax sp. J22R24]MDM0108016.1 hypothetical protein [Variovorax sp. J22R24]